MRFPSRATLGVISASVVGIGLSTFGTLMYILWPRILDAILSSQLVLAPGSQSYSMFEVTPLPIHFEFYFFNWTNPDQIYNRSSKPILVQVGPYVFREERRKVILSFNEPNSTITYLQNRTWFFVPELSNGTQDDLITTINVPAMSATFAVRNANFFQKIPLQVAFSTASLWVTAKVRHFLFEGYSDTMLKISQLPGISFFSPVDYPFDKFGWFYPRNGSVEYDGVFNMFTGAYDISRFGAIGSWNYVNQTGYFKPDCNRVNGSAGEFFPPNRDKDKGSSSGITLFVSDICRALKLPFTGLVEVDGIPGYRYEAPPDIFDNETSRPQNWCYCPSGPCPPKGTLDISSCKFGAPAFLSFPHFLHGDPSLRAAVEGMHADENEHKFFIDMEPKSGIPMKVSAALQINILLEPQSSFSFISGVPRIYFPCLWFRQSVQLNEELRSTVRLISLLPTVGSVTFLVMLSLGFLITAGLAIYLLRKTLKKQQGGPPPPNSPQASPRTKMKARLEAVRMSTVLQNRNRRKRVQPEDHAATPKVSYISEEGTTTAQLQNKDEVVGRGGRHAEEISRPDLLSSLRSRPSTGSKSEDIHIPPIEVNEEVRAGVANYM